MNRLQERAVLMKFSAGLPGQSRKDKRMTAQVKASNGLGDHAGKWIKDLWPEDALAAIKSKENEAREYHNTVTLPFGVKSEDASDDGATPAIAGIGILPATLLLEYGDKMRQFKGELDVLIAEFLDNPKRYVDWAVAEHNGTFDPKNYPGCFRDLPSQAWQVDAAKFRSEMRKKFYLRSEPLPVPDASQFTAAIHSLLGVDAESVNIRVRDAEIEAQRELMRRLIAPVQAMATKLAEEVKEGKSSPVFRDTLIGNIQAIVDLAPKLNLSGDAQIDGFIKEVESLTRYTPQVLRDDAATRSEAASKAAEMVKRLSGYKL